MYKFMISGYYNTIDKEGNKETDKYFWNELEAKDSTTAVQIVLGKVSWNESLEGKYVIFDRFHCECL